MQFTLFLSVAGHRDTIDYWVIWIFEFCNRDMQWCSYKFV